MLCSRVRTVSHDILALAHDLTSRGEAFALATVVRAESPTSAKPGCRAIIRADGSLTGWIGGSCSQPVIVREALAALQDGQPRLVAIVGTSGRGAGPVPGLIEHRSTCYSGGTLEIYVEPFVSKPLLVLVGESPVTRTLEHIGEAIDFRVAVVQSDEVAGRFAELPITSSSFVVIATHGMADEQAIQSAVSSPAGYVSLVASRKRADAVFADVMNRGVSREQIARVKAPAGLEIGAVTLEEVAVSILAELVQVRRQSGRVALDADMTESEATNARSAQRDAIDPVCGMTVNIATARFKSDVLGRPVYFCCERCRASFEQDPAKYAGALRS